VTSYNSVYKKFTNIITGTSHLSLTESELKELFNEYLSFAVFFFTECDKDLEARDDVAEEFTETLTETEQWVLAHAMVIGWLKPLVNYEENMTITIGDRDYNPASSANQLDKLVKLYADSVREADEYIMRYSYHGRDLSDLG